MTNVTPTSSAINAPRPARRSTIHGSFGNAYHVDHIAIGFMIGTATRNVTAQGTGSLLRSRFANVGTAMQSQTGMHNPAISATAKPPMVVRGRCRSRNGSVTSVATAADIIAPSSMKGTACSISPATLVPMRTSGTRSPCVSNACDAAMRKAVNGVPMTRNR